MGSVNVYSLTLEKLQQIANTIKEITIKGLYEEGLLKPGVTEKELSKYAVVVRRKGLFGEFFDRFRNVENPEATRFELVKIIEPKEKK